MMRTFLVDDKEYTWAQIKKSKHHISYWIVFPQGVIKKDATSTSYSSMMDARTFNKALKLAYRYNGAIIQRMVTSELGRWCIKEWYAEDLSYDEIWEKWKEENDEIQLFSKKVSRDLKWLL